LAYVWRNLCWGGDWELDAFDGTLTPILGPLDTPVPQDFFYRPQLKQVSNNLNYHATFSLEVRRIQDLRLIIENPKKDSAPIPVTLSMYLPDGGCRNFIITMPESNSISINMDNRIMEILKENSYNKEEVEDIAFTVLCGLPIDLHMTDVKSKGDDTPIEVNPPLDPPGGSNSPGNCYPCTSRGGIKLIHITNEQNGVTNLAYISMALGHETHQGVISYQTALEVDYPNPGNAFHLPTNLVSSSTWLNGDCIFPENGGPHTTQTWNERCNYHRQTHAWYHMDKVTNWCGSGYVVATSGCQAGMRWRVTP
jgi:hypothetical protein